MKNVKTPQNNNIIYYFFLLLLFMWYSLGFSRSLDNEKEGIILGREGGGGGTLLNRVRKVMEFYNFIFMAWKVMEFNCWSLKVMEN